MDRQHINAVRCIHAGEFENLIGDNLWTSIALQFDLNACFLIGKVAHAGDAGEDFFIHQFGDALLQCCAVDAVRHFTNRENALTTFLFIDLDATAQTHGAAASAEVFFDALEAADLALAGEVRSFDELHQLRQSNFWIVDLRANRIDDFAQVVRGEIGRHTHCDAGATIN